MSHPIVHIELSSHDRAESAKFYTNVFGWEIQDMPEMNYATFSAEGGPGGGFNPIQEDYPAGTVVVYIHSDDIEDTLQKIEANGGQTVVPKSEIPQTGYFALFKDPTGNLVGLYSDLGEE